MSMQIKMKINLKMQIRLKMVSFCYLLLFMCSSQYQHYSQTSGHKACNVVWQRHKLYQPICKIHSETTFPSLRDTSEAYTDTHTLICTITRNLGIQTHCKRFNAICARHIDNQCVPVCSLWHRHCWSEDLQTQLTDARKSEIRLRCLHSEFMWDYEATKRKRCPPTQKHEHTAAAPRAFRHN
jgi:hypothetical protein